MDTIVRSCRACGVVLPLVQFRKMSGGRWYHHICLACDRARQREKAARYRAAHRAEINRKNRAYRRRHGDVLVRRLSPVIRAAQREAARRERRVGYYALLHAIFRPEQAPGAAIDQRG
jgi:hypothetical protein